MLTYIQAYVPLAFNLSHDSEGDKKEKLAVHLL